MSLTLRSKRVLEVGLADRKAAAEIADAIDSGSNLQAASVAVIPASTNIAVPAVVPAVIADSAGTYVIPAEPTGAEVDAAINTLRDAVESGLDAKAENAAVVTAIGTIESRLDTLESKVNAIILALKAAGLMA